MREFAPPPEHTCDYLGGLLASADAEDDARSHRPLTSVLKLGPESSSSSQKFSSVDGEQQLLVHTDDSQQMFSAPDLLEGPKARRPITVDTKSPSEVPAGPGSPAEPGDLLGKPAASSLSALPNLHLQLMNNLSNLLKVVMKPGSICPSRLHPANPARKMGPPPNPSSQELKQQNR